jgi:hypothetical protein
MRSIAKEQSWAVGILFITYAISFLLPALGHGDPVFGWQAFLLGMIYCWALPWTIAWWANVLFWFGLMALSRCQYGKAAAFGLIALLLGLSFLCNAGGNQPHLGYFVWIGSMAGLLLTAIGKAVQAEAERSDFPPLVRNRSLGLEFRIKAHATQINAMIKRSVRFKSSSSIFLRITGGVSPIIWRNLQVPNRNSFAHRQLQQKTVPPRGWRNLPFGGGSVVDHHLSRCVKSRSADRDARRGTG